MRNLIPGLARPLLRLLGRDERGAIGVIIGVLIGGGVLLGIGALVIDLGFLYSERAQLQNGADAAALAVAKSCAQGACDTGIAPSYAGLNANDGASNATACIGSGCPAPTGAMVDCPGPPASGASYVDVHTSTLDRNGSTVIPPFFARALLGNGGYSGSTVLACAQASWGPPSSLDTLAFTISACSWDLYTKQGANFGPAPPYTAANPKPTLAAYPTLDQQFAYHDPTKPYTPQGCTTEPAGADGPGVFGWTDTTNPQNCTLAISGSTYGVSPGVSGSNCADALYSAWLNNTLVYIPVYVGQNPGSSVTSGSGNTATYTLKGYAAFVLTGYFVPGATAHGAGKDWLNPKNDCKGPDFCIDGFFTQGLVDAPPGAGNSLGLNAFALTG